MLPSNIMLSTRVSVTWPPANNVNKGHVYYDYFHNTDVLACVNTKQPLTYAAAPVLIKADADRK